jgi:hypothetical protein
MDKFIESWNNARFTREDVFNAINRMEEDAIVDQYNILIGEANTIEDLVNSINEAGIEIDEEHTLFMIEPDVEGGKIVQVNDKVYKKELLKRAGIIKG